MENISIVSLLSLLGVIISVTLSFIISKYQNKIELIKIHSEFIGKLYSKRLEAYLEIYELVSGYIKDIKRKGIIYAELLVFYENYSKLDSKSGILFSYTGFYSDQLMKRIATFLINNKTSPFTDNQKEDLLEKLEYVETTMKLELGVYVYRDPATIIKKYDFPERKKKMLEVIIQNYSKGNIEFLH